MSRIGERVGAIHTTSADEVQLFGFGVYVGREVPGPEAAGWLADMVREMGIPEARACRYATLIIQIQDSWPVRREIVTKEQGPKKEAV